MRIFAELSELIHDRWAAKGFNEASFPEVAARALSEAPPSEGSTPQDIIRWVLSTSRLPHQQNIDVRFGEPPVCLASTPRFYIEALFWIDGTTAIHQHGFSGAFHVLSGSSIHAIYDFETSDKINAHCHLGSTRLMRAELLAKGAVHAIAPGKGFIHALFHLERPSVTIVVRTINDPEAGPQYMYLPPSVAINPFFREATTTRRLQFLNVLAVTSAPTYLQEAGEMISRSDYLTAFLALRQCHDRGMTPADLDALMGAFRRAHGGRTDTIQAVLSETARQRYIVDRRKVVTNADHRFLLALLLNLRSREAILDLIAARHPGSEPDDLATRWLQEITQSGSTTLSKNDPLAIELGDAEVTIVRKLLVGARDTEIMSILAQDYDDVVNQQEEVFRFCRALRASPLYGGLFGA